MKAILKQFLETFVQYHFSLIAKRVILNLIIDVVFDNMEGKIQKNMYSRNRN